MSKKDNKIKNQNIDSEFKPLGLNPFLVTTRAKYYLGLTARALAVSLCVFSMLYFILDTINILQYTSNLSLLVVSLIFTFPIVFSMQHKWVAWTSAALVVIIIGLHIRDFDFMNIVLTGTNLVDFTFERLADMGFTYFINVSTGYGYITDLETTVMYIVITLGLLVSVIYSLSFGKKTNLYAPVILNIIIVAPSFICNILNTNWGTAFLAISYCTMAMLFVSDKLFADMSNPKRYDTETILNPAFVIGIDEPAFVDKKEKKKKQKIKKKQKYVALDDELDDLIGQPVSRKKGKLTKKEREELRLEKKTKHLKKYAKSAIAGFSALAIFVVGYLSILIPALVVDKNFKKINLIDGSINEIREYVTALLLGDDLTLDLKSYENYNDNFAPHSTELKPREYEQKVRFHVEVQRMMPVYLRGWIANEYKDGAWYLNTESESFEEYRKMFGVREDVHEKLLDLFYKYMNPGSTTSVDNYLTQYSTQVKFGYVTMQVNISRYFGGTTSLYVPTFIQSKYGLRSYRSVHENPEMTYSNFFDGVYSSRNSKHGAKYALVANVPTMRDDEYSTNISELIAEFNTQTAYLKFERSKKSHEVYTCKSKDSPNYGMPVNCRAIVGVTPLGYNYEIYTPMADKKMIKVYGPYGEYVYHYDVSRGTLLSSEVQNPKIDPETGAQYIHVPPTLELAIRYYHIYSETEQQEIQTLMTQLNKYSEYVYNTYLQKADSAVITEFAKNFSDYYATSAADTELSMSSQKYLDRHNLVLAIADYLKENYTYTLTPSSMGDDDLTGVENFLTVVKEGYCVQFASTLALTLREFGIPTRYVEGYVASDYSKNPFFNSTMSVDVESLDTPMRYYTDVLDSDEHSWVEVWFDGIGWVQYEATPPMMSSYYPGLNTDDPDDPYNPPETDTDTTMETTEPIEPDTSETLPDESTDQTTETTAEATTETDTDTSQLLNVAMSVGRIITIILPIAVVAIIVYLEIRRIKTGDKKRAKLVTDAKSATEQGEIKKFSTILSDRIFELLAIFNLSPLEDELPDEFKLRVAKELIRLQELMKPKVESVEDYDASNDPDTDDEDQASDENIISDEEIMLSDEYLMISNAIQSLEAEEFGHGMSQSEIASAADFYAELLKVRPKKVGFLKNIFYRYILNRI